MKSGTRRTRRCGGPAPPTRRPTRACLQAAYPAVKSADPAAKVVLGGLTGNDYDFLEGVYKAGGKGYFDAIGVHTDTACDVNSPFAFLRNNDGQINEDSFIGYREVHATEIANGDDVPIWMTEMSWRTTSAECGEGAFAGQKPEGVSEAQQASYLTEAYHCLAQAPYVKLGLWYPIDDEGAVVSGLERANRSHKPSYAAMRAYIKHGDRMKGACGDFSGPKIRVETPTNGDRYSGHLWIRVRATDSVGIESIRLLYDGHSIRNFDPFVEGKGYPQTVLAQIHWSGARHISLGHHTLTILAYDKLKNVSRTNVSIVHLPEGSPPQVDLPSSGEHPPPDPRRRPRGAQPQPRPSPLTGALTSANGALTPPPGRRRATSTGSPTRASRRGTANFDES